MYTLSCLPSSIFVGRQSENNFKNIEFDVSDWVNKYPQAYIYIAAYRPDGYVYLPEVERYGEKLIWNVSNVDTAAPGTGEIELRVGAPELLGKSQKITTFVATSITGTGTAPAPPPDWTEEAAALDARVKYLKEHGTGDSFDIHALQTEDNITDADETPFYDASEAAQRKTTWSNVKAKLKAYFDTLYLGASALVGYATKAWVQASYRTAEEQDSIDTELGALVVDIFYNGEIFFPSVPFKTIVKAVKRGRTVFAKYCNGNTFILPFKRATNRVVYFGECFADTAYCLIFPNNYTLLYSGKQRCSWIENGAIAVNPVEFLADVYGYTEENSLCVNLTSVREHFDQEFHMPNGETEVLPSVRTTYIADKTFSEIHESWADDKTIWCVLDSYNLYNLFSYSPADEGRPAVFVFTKAIDADMVSGFRITSDSEIEMVSVQVYESMGDDDDEEY